MFRKIVISLLTLCIIILIAEFAARYGLYNYELYKSYQLTKNYYGLKSDFSEFKNIYEKRANRFSQRGEPFIADRYNRRYYLPALTGHNLGFIQKEPALEKADGVTRILCVGTSTVEMGFPRPLQDILNVKYPGRFEVINAGIPGATVLNNFMNYSLIWRKLKPDIVVLEHNIDDIRPNGNMPFYISADYPEREKHYIEQNSLSRNTSLPALYRLAYGVFFRGLDDNNRRKGPADEGIDRYETTLNSFVDLIKGSGAVPVFMTYQPTLSAGEKRGKYSEEFFSYIIAFYQIMFFDFTIEGTMRTIDAHNEIIREVAGEKDLPLADTVGMIPRIDKFYKDGTHLSETGSILVAYKLINVLENAGMIGAPANEAQSTDAVPNDGKDSREQKP